jgi:hypothetical protein
MLYRLFPREMDYIISENDYNGSISGGVVAFPSSFKWFILPQG